jgi:hypothetical protein
MKIFLTEYKIGQEIVDGPVIAADSFEEAEEEAQVYNLIVVGMLDVYVLEPSETSMDRVLH